MKAFRIDPEFERLHRKLTKEEQSQLWGDLNERGILSPLIVWKEERILLDGHNRHGWARLAGKDDADLPTEFVSFADRTAALRWVIRLQLARRNLTPDEASLLRGKAFNLEKLNHQDAGKRKGKSPAQNEPGLTAERLAKEHGVSAATIKRDGQFATAVETVAKYVPELVPDVQSGASPFGRGMLVELAERIQSDPGVVEELRERLTSPPPTKMPKKEMAPKDEDLERRRRFNVIRDLTGDIYRASISLAKLGSAARREFWFSSPTIREVSTRALINLQTDINRWVEEIKDDKP